MEKIINPCKCKLYDMHSKIIEVPAFVKIEYKEKARAESVINYRRCRSNAKWRLPRKLRAMY